jgi:hypothetical protein
MDELFAATCREQASEAERCAYNLNAIFKTLTPATARMILPSDAATIQTCVVALETSARTIGVLLDPPTPNPTLCPRRVQSSLEAYVRGLPPGSFVRAVLSNDLNEAIARADDVNIHALPHIVAYVREHLPAVAWGSSEKVNRWLSKAGDSTRPKSTPSLSEGDQL